MNFSRCQGICPTSDINRSCLIYSCLIYLASCSPILPWFWAFVEQGRLPEGTELQPDIEYLVLREMETSDLSWKEINLLFFLVLVQQHESVGSVECMPFSLWYCVPKHIHLNPWCSTIIPLSTSTDLHQCKLFSIAYCNNRIITFIWHLYAAFCQEPEFCFLMINEIS